MRLFSGANLREISQSTLWDYFAEAIFLWASQEPASLVAEQLSSRESDPFIRCSVSAGAILPSLHFFSFILPDDIVIFRFFFGLSLRYFEQYCPSREACASFGIRYDQFRLVRLSCFSRFSFLFFLLISGSLQWSISFILCDSWIRRNIHEYVHSPSRPNLAESRSRRAHLLYCSFSFSALLSHFKGHATRFKMIYSGTKKGRIETAFMGTHIPASNPIQLRVSTCKKKFVFLLPILGVRTHIAQSPRQTRPLGLCTLRLCLRLGSRDYAGVKIFLPCCLFFNVRMIYWTRDILEASNRIPAGNESAVADWESYVTYI